jgi:2-keto-4-pentenoate hydratase
MALDRIEQAAQFLADLYGPGPRPATLPAELSPQDAQQAYAIQQAVGQRLGQRTAARKVAMAQPDQGSWAPIFSDRLHRSPARVAALPGMRVGIEPEIAFTLGRELPRLPQGEHYSRAQLVEAIDSAYAAIEIVVSRFQSHEGARPLDRLADGISNGGLVLSEPCREWRAVDLRQVPMRLTLIDPDGTRRGPTGSGHPLGDPLLPLLWLVSDRAAAGDGIRAGEPVTTGSYAGLHYVTPGGSVELEFSGVGTVRLEVS